MKTDVGDEKSQSLSAAARPGRLGVGAGVGSLWSSKEEMKRKRREEETDGRDAGPSDNLLDAGPLEAAGAALLLDLTG